jgi:hypothetical protein
VRFAALCHLRPVGWIALAAGCSSAWASTAAVIAQRFTGPVPDVRAARPEVPHRVQRALARALALDSEARFETVEGFAAALRQETVAVLRARDIRELCITNY